MNAKVILFMALMSIIALCKGNPVGNYNDGKYQVSETTNSDGKYRPASDGKYHPNSNNEGRRYQYRDGVGYYMHNGQPYRHQHDNRELGFYVHVPNPYNGGYGPYAGSLVPYIHDDRPYDHNLYTSTTTKKPTTTTKRTTTTTTTTTTTPRNILFNYDDEGRHKILHQEEIRKQNKYDHAYLTENGIYGEEQAKINQGGGTDAKGYYEYTGDDGKLYRVNYSSNSKGFMPMGDHIPTPPPIPEAIARALKFVEEKRRANGDMPIFDQRGFRINGMPKELMAKVKAIKLDSLRLSKKYVDQIRELQEEMEEMERKEKHGITIFK